MSNLKQYAPQLSGSPEEARSLHIRVDRDLMELIDAAIEKLSKGKDGKRISRTELVRKILYEVLEDYYHDE